MQRQVRSIQLLFQITDQDIKAEQDSPELDFEKENIQSFLFAAADLQDLHSNYSRGDYAALTREISKRFPMPVFVLFRHQSSVTLAFADRREHKTDAARDVLGKVSLLRGINCLTPHAGHINILHDLSLSQRLKWITKARKARNFDQLHKALLHALSGETLNKHFYQELFAWFEWACKNATFPHQQDRNAESHVIRLIIRLLFVWFIKEKGLVAPELFDQQQASGLLKHFGGDNDNDDTDHYTDQGHYYRAVLQNLFFATLNTEINQRGFSTKTNITHRNFNRYRYQDLMQDASQLQTWMQKTPFINGGLFDCLDSEAATSNGGYRIDCFTDNHAHRKQLHVPDRLFFDSQQGLFALLNKYQFTVEERTPIEQDVALDPELLGQVFENLLAAYNPETSENARKKTGSYYTPAKVVDYMAQESLLAHLSSKVQPADAGTANSASFFQERLRYLLDATDACNDASELFEAHETQALARAIAQLKVLDPAVGSGAFPMGMLHQLVLALQRLDPNNTHWKQLQVERATLQTQHAFGSLDSAERQPRLQEINHTFERYSGDFGRKLYLIQNNLYGVDIQPVACQIARLRFFISLMIEQQPTSDPSDNYGIQPLPNLETRFVNADTLLGVSLAKQRNIFEKQVTDTQAQLAQIRERHFHAQTRQAKRDCTEEFNAAQQQLAKDLQERGAESDAAEKIAHWNPFDQNTAADWFDPQWMFGETQGFDIVIGNPPYVRHELIKQYKPQFETSYPNTYTSKADLYVYFYEQGVQLLADGGHLCYITSNKWMRTQYGGKLRAFLKDGAQIQQLIDFKGQQIFKATVDTNILLCSTAGAQAQQAANFKYGFQLPGPQHSLQNMALEALGTNASAYILQQPHEQALKAKIEAAGKQLKNWDIEIRRGVTTGRDKAFVIDTDTRDTLIQQDPKSAEIIKPTLKGEDIQPYHIQWAGQWLIATLPSHLNIDNYPAIKKHLLAFGKERLEQSGAKLGNKSKPRKKTKHQWFELQDKTEYHYAFEQEKIVYSDIGSDGCFAWDAGSYYTQNTCYIIANSNKYLLAVLRSQTIKYYMYLIAASLGKKTLRWTKQYVERLPIPKVSKLAQQPFIDRVDQIIAAKQTDPHADISAQQAAIDQLVYDQYQLTPAEIQIIEQTLA
ncbi:MAG: Eco57I restriction-modification methylase domain-containing protein [Gammaproteobacteria bacterium]